MYLGFVRVSQVMSALILAGLFIYAVVLSLRCRRQPRSNISNHTYIYMRACTRLYGGILYGREQPGKKFSISDCFPAGYGRMHYVPVYKAV